MTRNTTRRAVSATFLTALLAVAVSGCSGAGSTDYTPHDINVKHPIQVASETVSVVVQVPTGTSLAASPEDAGRLREFIRNYVERGRTAITVETQMGDRAREFLTTQGLRAGEIHIVTDTTLKAPNAALSFTANVAKVPECGDWSDMASFDPNNRPLANFGCSNRRNLGLTVADPGDLIDHQPVTGKGAARRDTILDSFNSGETIGPAPQTIDTRSSVSSTAGN